MTLAKTLSTFPSTLLDRDRLETKVLCLLNLEVIDLQDYCDDIIPDGYARFYLKRSGKTITTISTWGDRYCTQAKRQINGYPSLYEAATCWIDRERLQLIEAMATGILSAQQQSIRDYF
jgi:hypothetical protein